MVYWISGERESYLKSEIHIHYFKKRGLFDGTLICVCLISQKTIQYVTCLKILDSLAPHTKMIDGAKNIHDFEINRLMDSAIHLYLITLPELLPPTCYCSNVVKSRRGSANSSHE